MLPASWFMSARAFHRTHVFLTRLTNAPILILITLFERMRQYARTSNLSERIQRALPKRMQEVSIFMSGAHADIEAVFDYSPDAKLLAAAAAQDEWATTGDEDGMASAISRVTGMGSPTALREVGPDDTDEEDAQEDEDRVGNLPRINTLDQRKQTDGILSSSPVRTRTIGPTITFDSSSRRASHPPGPVPPPPRLKEVQKDGEKETHQSPLQRLYAGRNNTLDTTMSRAGGFDAAPPSWVLELNATLRAIEGRQRHLESILAGGADSEGSEGDNRAHE